ncbi:MAG: phosphatidylglycerophosphatase A family protein [Gammaproteobacteria bacterium]
MSNPTVSMLRNPIHFLSLGFGSGLAPKAPGTFGTMAGVAVYLTLANISSEIYLISVTLLFILGIYLCDVTAKALGVHDHGAIVWDEIVGFLATMSFVKCSIVSIFLGFALFRLFDILKPWPISWLDKKVQGGFGIMLDDLIAAIFAASILAFIEYLSYI